MWYTQNRFTSLFGGLRPGKEKTVIQKKKVCVMTKLAIEEKKNQRLI